MYTNIMDTLQASRECCDMRCVSSLMLEEKRFKPESTPEAHRQGLLLSLPEGYQHGGQIMQIQGLGFRIRS